MVKLGSGATRKVEDFLATVRVEDFYEALYVRIKHGWTSSY